MSHFFVCFVALVIQGGAMASSLRTDFFSEKKRAHFLVVSRITLYKEL